MKKLILGALALGCAALSGCATTGFSVTPKAAYIAANAFDAAEATATNYLTLPVCPAAKLCRTAAGVAAVTKAVRTARAARNGIEAFVKANPGSAVPVTLADALSAAVQALQAILTQYGA